MASWIGDGNWITFCAKPCAGAHAARETQITMARTRNFFIQLLLVGSSPLPGLPPPGHQKEEKHGGNEQNKNGAVRTRWFRTAPSTSVASCGCLHSLGAAHM